MVNIRRGEVEAFLDGRSYRLCLTLGALAELEHAFGEADMVALTKRFEDGRLSATDAIKIIGAGMRGGGGDMTDDEIARMSADLGAVGFVDIVTRLLSATFGGLRMAVRRPTVWIWKTGAATGCRESDFRRSNEGNRRWRLAKYFSLG